MQLNITIQADSDNPLDMTALAALIAALGGRADAAPFLEVRGGKSDSLHERIVSSLNGPNAQTTGTTSSGAASEPTDSAQTVDVGAPDRDSAGIPWDGRIHSESRATVADGTWRKRRGVDEATVAAVMAELRIAQGDAGKVGLTPSPSPDDTPPPPAEPVVTEPAAAVADNASDDTPPPPPASDGPDLSTWPQFVQAVQSKPDVSEAAKTYDKLNELSETFQVKKFLEMKDKPGQWAMFYDMVG